MSIKGKSPTRQKVMIQADALSDDEYAVQVMLQSNT